MQELAELKILASGELPLICWGLKINDECKPQGRQRDGQWIPYPELYEIWTESHRDWTTVEIEGQFAYRVGRQPWRAARGKARLQLRAEPSALAKLIVDDEELAFFANGLWWYPDQNESGSLIELGSLNEVIHEVGRPGRLSRPSGLAEHAS
jgi:hypothetical protein